MRAALCPKQIFLSGDLLSLFGQVLITEVSIRQTGAAPTTRSALANLNLPAIYSTSESVSFAESLIHPLHRGC